MKWAGRPHVALGRVGFPRIPHDFAPDDLAQGGAVAQFVQESRGQRHIPEVPQPRPRAKRPNGAWFTERSFSGD